MRVFLIRHGITISNEEKRFAGCRTDCPLSEKGIEALKSLNYPRPDRVYVSPMLRCRQTADIIFNNHKKIVVDELKEIDFGDFENKNHTELDGNPHYQAWIDSGGLGSIPDGESFDVFAKRCVPVFVDILEKEKSQNVSFVIHGGTIMAIMNLLCGMSCFDALSENGKGFECTYECGKLTVVKKL